MKNGIHHDLCSYPLTFPGQRGYINEIEQFLTGRGAVESFTWRTQDQWTLRTFKCARPYGPAEQILNKDIVSPKSGEQQTKLTVTRNKQFIGSGSGGMCKFLVAIDGGDVALLKQNQFVTVYIKNGPHKLRVSNECNVLSMGLRKTLDIIADGTEQEFIAENGLWGQYRMWRSK